MSTGESRGSTAADNLLATRRRFASSMAEVVKELIDTRLMPSEILANDDLDFWIDSQYWSEEIAERLVNDIF